MRILVTDAVEKVCVDMLKAEGFQVDVEKTMPAEKLKSAIGSYEALIVRSATNVTADVIASAGVMKVIGRAGAGVDNIDVDAATRKGIVVMNTPGGNTISTAEHTMSMLLSLSRNIPQAFDSLRQGKWDRKTFVGTELFGKTIGIVGLGKIGREVAVRCQAFGMTTIGFDPVLGEDIAAKMNIQLVSLEEIYQRSDFITVHTPLNDETRGLLSDTQFGKCKQGVRVLNCARGGIIDEAALMRALESGKVAGAAVDVFETEPPGDHPLLKHPKVIATPHLGASTEEAQEKVAIQIAQQIADYLKDRGVAGAVNADVIHMATKKEIKPYVQLGEKLGSLLAQMMNGQLKKLNVRCSGSYLVQSSELVSAAVLKGILSHVMTEPVNLINAPVLARERGIVIKEQKESEHAAYTHLLTVEYETDKEQKNFAGTVFGNSNLRVVKIDGYHLEINPEGHLLFYRNIDKPGMLATVGSILAQAGINIAGLALGRDMPGQQALTIINIDSPIPVQILRQLEKVDGVFEVRTVKL
ncbi:MAG: phosphoglycerate dehydrogenase [Ignavibacteriae bacterium]|nr:phosphoglycerate dehydrogenase [Ignavibacteriota bacterium]